MLYHYTSLFSLLDIQPDIYLILFVLLCVVAVALCIHCWSIFTAQPLYLLRRILSTDDQGARYADSSRAPGLTFGIYGSMNVHCDMLLFVQVTVHQFFRIWHLFLYLCLLFWAIFISYLFVSFQNI